MITNKCIEKDTSKIDEISELISGLIYKNKCNCELLQLQKDVNKISEIVENLQSTINEFLGDNKVTIKYENGKLIISSSDGTATIDLSSDSQIASVNDINSLYNPFNANNYQYVDLGLPSGTLWATCNLGADNLEDAGNYYAWGQIYDWVQTQEKGTEDTDIQGTKYDAAHVNWGGDWVIPSYEQILELIDNCNITFVDTYFVLTSKINEATLIFPNTHGYYLDATSLQNLGMKNSGFIWSSTGDYNLQYFKNEDSYTLKTFPKNYNAGITIRPVIVRSFKYDDTVSSYSTNAVQNKVIKEYIDSLLDSLNLGNIVTTYLGASKFILYKQDEDGNLQSTYITIEYDSDKNQAYIWNDKENYKVYFPSFDSLTANDTIALDSDVKKKADLFNNDQEIRTSILQAVNNLDTKEILLEYSYPNTNNVFELEDNPKLSITYPDSRNLRVQKEEANYYVELPIDNLTQDETIAYKSDIEEVKNNVVSYNNYDISVTDKNLNIKLNTNQTEES